MVSEEMYTVIFILIFFSLFIIFFLLVTFNIFSWFYFSLNMICPSIFILWFFFFYCYLMFFECGKSQPLFQVFFLGFQLLLLDHLILSSNSFFFFFFWLSRMACRILVPQSGIEPTPAALESTTGQPGKYT